MRIPYERPLAPRFDQTVDPQRDQNARNDRRQLKAKLPQRAPGQTWPVLFIMTSRPRG
jgi:hypothetical protein